MAEIVKKTPAEAAQVKTGRGVIESEVFDASRKARVIVQDAQNKAVEILAQAERDAARIREHAHDKGFSEGQQEGLAQLEQTIVSINQEYQDLAGQAQSELLNLATGVAQRILGRELTVNPQAVIEIVRKAIAPMNRKKSVTLRVNPVDRQTLDQHRAEILEAMINGGHIQLIADPEITRGGCLVETEHGTVDARLETQLTVFHQLLTGEQGFAPLVGEEAAVEEAMNVQPISVPIIQEKILPTQESFEEEEEVESAESPEDEYDFSTPHESPEAAESSESSDESPESPESSDISEAQVAEQLEEVMQELPEHVDVNDILKSLDDFLGGAGKDGEGE